MADGDRQARPPQKADLKVRAVSAVVMLAISGTALWLGGFWWTAFVVLVGFGVWFEWSVLAMLAHSPGMKRQLWRVAGAVYCALAASILILLRDHPHGVMILLMLLGAVIGTDVGAYFAGRTIGGPKIAPMISPSKTWAGLAGGILGASLVIYAVLSLMNGRAFDLSSQSEMHRAAFTSWTSLGGALLAGAFIAIVAQTGDFFESWLKRRAGVKDSGRLIPGHGGLFDRVDGLLAVCFVLGFILLVTVLSALAAGESLLPSPA